MSNTTGSTYGAGTAYPFGTPDHNPGFSGIRVARSLVLCVMFCRSLSILFPLATVLSVLLRFKAFDYSIGIFKLLVYSNDIIDTSYIIICIINAGLGIHSLTFGIII
jgi:hypothetical protein